MDNTFEMTKGDKLPEIECQLVDEDTGDPIDITGYTIKLNVRKPAPINKVHTEVNVLVGKFKFVWAGSNVDSAGAIILPGKALKKDNRYQRDKKCKRCRRRAAIESIIGHLKSDCRLA